MNKGHGTKGVLDRAGRIARQFLLPVLLALSACSTPQYETVNRDVLDEIQGALSTASLGTGATAEQPPEEVLQALVPGLTLESAALQPVEERFDFAVEAPMDAREFFPLLTEGTDYSIALHPGIGGTISALSLRNVTIQEAMDQVSALYGYQITRTGNIFQVTPGGLQTRIFKVDYLNVVRSGSSTMSVVTSGLNGGGGNGNNNNNNNNDDTDDNNNDDSNNNNNNNNNNGGNGSSGGLNSGGANITTSSEANYWEGLAEIITSIIGTAQPDEGVTGGLLEGWTSNIEAGGGRVVVVDPQTGIIMVRAYPKELDQVAAFLAESQSALQRQVVLEAKILEVTLNDSFQSGIDLSFMDRINTNNILSARSNFFNETQSITELGAPGPIPLDGIPGALQLAYDATNFDGVIRLLETQGNVQVISNPRITTLNNQKAVFKVGDEEYFSTDQSTTTVTGGNSTTRDANVSLEPFFSGIALDVTPQISAEGDIILHIHPLLNSVEADDKTVGGVTLTLPKSDTRESDSIARVRSGEFVIISGLMQERARGSEAGVPGVRDVPVIGNGFERTQREMEKTELVILLRAIVDDPDTMQGLIQEQNDRFGEIRRQVDPYFR
jgi:MSHA biogenesis protein MshL